MSLREVSAITVYNGDVCEGNAANILQTDRAFHYGDGVFETLRVANSSLPLLTFHLKRLEQACSVLGIAVSMPQLHRYLQSLLDRWSETGLVNGVLKIIVSRGFGGRASYPSENATANIFMHFSPLQGMFNWCQQSVTVVMASGRLAHNCSLVGVKHLNRLDYIVAVSKQVFANDEEALLCDIDDHVIETMHHNIFFVRDGQLCTPMLEKVGVAGIMRRVVMEQCAATLGLQVREQSICFTDLVEAEEIFLTNAVRGVVPVKGIGKTPKRTDVMAMAVSESLNKLYPV